MEVGRKRDRDQELTALFTGNYDPLRRLAFVMLGDGAMAEEVVMDVFAKAMSRWTLFSRAEHPTAYLRQMVVNLCRSRVRRKVLERRWTETFERDARDALDQGPEEHGLDRHVWAAVKALPMRQRACIVLRYLEDLSEPEIAGVLEIPLGTVKSQLSRARRKLADSLGADIAEAPG